ILIYLYKICYLRYNKIIILLLSILNNHKKERSILSKLRDEELHMHKINQGKLKLESKVPVKNAYDLSLDYSHGVAEKCKEIYSSKNAEYDYTMKGNTVCVVNDGVEILNYCYIGVV